MIANALVEDSCYINFKIDENGVLTNESACVAMDQGAVGSTINPYGITKETFINKNTNSYECVDLYGGLATSGRRGAVTVSEAPIQIDEDAWVYPKKITNVEGSGSPLETNEKVDNEQICNERIVTKNNDDLSGSHPITIYTTENNGKYNVSFSGVDGAEIRVDPSLKQEYINALKNNTECPSLTERAYCESKNSNGFLGIGAYNDTICYLGESVLPNDIDEGVDLMETVHVGEGIGDTFNASSALTPLPGVDLGSSMNCNQLLGPTITKLIRILIDVLKIAGAIICIVKMMLTLIPPITSKDADALNKAIRTCVILLVILTVILLIDTLLVIIGRIFAFDLSCFK